MDLRSRMLVGWLERKVHPPIYRVFVIVHYWRKRWWRKMTTPVNRTPSRETKMWRDLDLRLHGWGHDLIVCLSLPRTLYRMTQQDKNQAQRWWRQHSHHSVLTTDEPRTRLCCWSDNETRTPNPSLMMTTTTTFSNDRHTTSLSTTCRKHLFFFFVQLEPVWPVPNQRRWRQQELSAPVIASRGRLWLISLWSSTATAETAKQQQQQQRPLCPCVCVRPGGKALEHTTRRARCTTY